MMNGTLIRSFSHFQVLNYMHTHTHTLAEILKFNDFEVCLHSL